MMKKKFLLIALSSLTFGACTTDDVEVASGDWIKKSALDGVARHAAVGFVIDNMGYLGLGADEDNKKQSDFWKFDPVKNSWSQVANYIIPF